MNNTAIVGIFHGDEGKGRIVYDMSYKYEYVARTAGSSNCGHTLYDNGRKIVRRLLPSINFNYSHTKAFLGSGMVINPSELLQEIKEANEMFPGASSKIIVDPDAFLITQKHLEEDLENKKLYGSTGKGVSPAYRDKIYRKGTKLLSLVKDNNPVIEELKNLGVQFKHSYELYNDFSSSNILFEGAQAVLLDINHGTYPFVTSGDCTPAGIFNCGFAMFMPTKVFGISKAYSTRVGEGPYPTEIFNEEAENLRTIGKEYGAVTSRPRRIGWLDLPALKYACDRSGITDLIITKLDVLNDMPIKVCVDYEQQFKSANDFFTAKPVYKELSGWKDSKNKEQIKEFTDLVEDYSKRKISYISCGVNKEDLIKL